MSPDAQSEGNGEEMEVFEAGVFVVFAKKYRGERAK